MNLENINLLSQKVDGVLATIRGLRQEIADLKNSLAASQAELQDKSILLETANANLADCRAALDARANQAAVQDDLVKAKESEIEALNQKVSSLEQNVSDLQGNLDQTNGNLVNANEEITRLKAEISTKDDSIRAQADEIADAQEKFNQLLATIEKELGTEFPVEKPTAPAKIEPVVEKPVLEEPVLDFSMADDDDVPVEIHPADEADAEKNASKEGSQNGFFGLGG